MAAQHGQPRFFRRSDDFQRDSGFAVDALDEMPSVDRTTARFGRDRPGQRHMPPPKLVRADTKGLDGAVHRILAELAAGRKAFA